MNTEKALARGYVRVGDYIPVPVAHEMAHVSERCELLGGYHAVVVILYGRPFYKITHSPFQSAQTRRSLMLKLVLATGIVVRPPWYVRLGRRAQFVLSLWRIRWRTFTRKLRR